MSTEILGAAGSGADRIGRYFTVVSALPAAVFVAYVYLLAKTGAWSGPADWSAFTDVSFTDIAVLGIGSFVLALVLNPLQFVLIQFFEGYWGASALAERLAAARIRYHQVRRQTLRDKARAEPAPGGNPTRSRVRTDESNRLAASYPERSEHVLPTRLGNVLRRYETEVGRNYGLDLITTVPRVAMVAHEREVAYTQNQRVQMELAIRTALLSFAATPVTVAFLWRHAGWILVALVPYGLGYLSYRGAVALAHEYAISLAVMIDLNRFELYERLRLELPGDTTVERNGNRDLLRLFRSWPPIRPVRYDPDRMVSAEPDAVTAGEPDGDG